MQSLLEVTNPQFKHKRDHKRILHIFQLDMRMCHEEEKNEKRNAGNFVCVLVFVHVKACLHGIH